MITRDPEGAHADRHDLIIVGGGVYGVALALEASARGLRALLLERGDFGAQTSAKSLRILHGGLRYLQTGDLARFRDSVAQRRWWLATFPDLVRPLPCLLPLYSEGLLRPSLLRPVLLANDLLSGDRNRGVRRDRRIPGSSILGAGETRERFPFLPSRRLRGGALWYDASMESPHRLLVEMLRWAVRGGATALNYVEVTGLLVEGDRVAGVRARDGVGGGDLEYRAPLVVNAAGPWVRRLARAAGDEAAELFRPSLAFNLLLSRPLPGEGALGIRTPGAGGRIYFLRPRGRFTFAGTGHAPWGDLLPPPERTPEPLIAELLSDLRRALPGFEVSPRDVVRDTCGLLPAAASGSQRLTRRPVLREHGREQGPRGLISVSGVKFTTAPGVARDALDLAFGRRSRRDRAEFFSSPPAVRRLPSADEFRDLHGHDPDTAAELLQTLVREEAVVTLEDLLARRLDWALDIEDPAKTAEEIRPLLGREGISLPDR
ncbi:MAG: FAD-dependent oxidoreductase [Thermoanaerobaculia bacterium]